MSIDAWVMCTTASITATLGYTKDMWTAINFIDFLHPKDRLTFMNQITRGVFLPFRYNLKILANDPGKTKINAEHKDS